MVKNCPNKSKNHSSAEKEVKKAKVQKKVWKPKVTQLKDEDIMDSKAQVTKTIKILRRKGIDLWKIDLS